MVWQLGDLDDVTRDASLSVRAAARYEGLAGPRDEQLRKGLVAGLCGDP